MELARSDGEMPKHDPYRLPKRFPVYLDEFLRLVIGGKYKANRLKTYRAFLRSQNVVDVESVLTRDRTKGFEDHWFGQVRVLLLQWIALQRKEKASKAGRASWSQGRRKATISKKWESGT